jgi:hypothetical protein
MAIAAFSNAFDDILSLLEGGVGANGSVDDDLAMDGGAAWADEGALYWGAAKEGLGRFLIEGGSFDDVSLGSVPEVRTKDIGRVGPKQTRR